jgi:hypothetical protein
VNSQNGDALQRRHLTALSVPREFNTALEALIERVEQWSAG